MNEWENHRVFYSYCSEQKHNCTHRKLNLEACKFVGRIGVESNVVAHGGQEFIRHGKNPVLSKWLNNFSRRLLHCLCWFVYSKLVVFFFSSLSGSSQDSTQISWFFKYTVCVNSFSHWQDENTVFPSCLRLNNNRSWLVVWLRYNLHCNPFRIDGGSIDRTRGTVFKWLRIFDKWRTKK